MTKRPAFERLYSGTVNTPSHAPPARSASRFLTNRQSVLASSRQLPASLILATLLSLSFGFTFAAPSLKEVRVGAHSNFVRVVFESDARLEATTRRPRPGLVEVLFPSVAVSAPALRDPGRQLKSLKYRNEDSSLVVSLEPAFQSFSLRRYRMSRPDRLVLEIAPEVQPPAPQTTKTSPEAAVSSIPRLSRKHIVWVGGGFMVVALTLGVALVYRRVARRQVAPETPEEPSESVAQKLAGLDEKIHSLLAEYRELGRRRET